MADEADDDAGPSYPPQVEVLHAAMSRLVAVSEITTGKVACQACHSIADLR
ncbi:hypothetical protein NA78x_002128 [Anatilimnocola sp. NA78]|uniref:hypothetical protein n=1 Tax=Anatilimnocola sp. NA78 TaxID=3415683 RepID=UPI003CE472E4